MDLMLNSTRTSPNIFFTCKSNPLEFNFGAFNFCYLQTSTRAMSSMHRAAPWHGQNSFNLLLLGWNKTLFSPNLTHYGRVTHICVCKLTIIWSNAGILLIGSLGTNFSETSIAVQTFSFKKMHLKMSSAKWRPLCLGLNVAIGNKSIFS